MVHLYHGELLPEAATPEQLLPRPSPSRHARHSRPSGLSPLAARPGGDPRDSCKGGVAVFVAGGHGRMSCRGELQEEFQGRAWGFGRVPRVPTVAQEPEVREEVLMSASRPPARVDGGGV